MLSNQLGLLNALLNEFRAQVGNCKVANTGLVFELSNVSFGTLKKTNTANISITGLSNLPVKVAQSDKRLHEMSSFVLT